MNVLLLNPYLLKGKQFYGFMNKLGSRLPPLGLAYIGGYLEKNGHNVVIIDNKIEELTLDSLRYKIDKFNPDFIGIASITTHLLHTIISAKYLKKNLENVKIIVGGPHASAAPEELLNFCKEIDYIIAGEGEEPFLKLIENINKKEDVKEIPGIIYRAKNGNIIKNSAFFIENIDKIPFPARHLLPMEKYKPSPINYKSLPSRSLITSRGCQFNCSYCFKISSGKVRYNSEQKVLEEILILINDYHAKELIFWDDCFIINKKRLINLFKLLRQNKIDIPWNAMARTDQIQKRFLIELKKSGCWRLGFGIESGDDNVLQRMNKNISLKRSQELLNSCRRIGIETRIFLILGSPYETKKSIKKTITIAKTLNPDIAQFSYHVPFPLTEDYNYIIQNNMSFDPQYYFKDVYPDYHNLDKLIYVPPDFTEKEIKRYHALAYINFYFRVKYILNRIKSIRTRFDIYKNLSISFDLVKDLIQKFLS